MSPNEYDLFKTKKYTFRAFKTNMEVSNTTQLKIRHNECKKLPRYYRVDYRVNTMALALKFF